MDFTNFNSISLKLLVLKLASKWTREERMISGNPMRASVRQKRTAAVESKPLKAELLEDLSKFVKWLVIKTF